MLKSLFSGVSGLQSHQVAMDVESNNIANVNTVGYKYSRANFSDLLAQTKAISTAPQGDLGGKNAVQVGLGSTVNSTTRIFSQGSIQNSDKNTDVAIQGDGFFIISPDGGNSYQYTRAGDFKFDANGNFVDNNGFIAQGWLRDSATGLVDSTASIANINISPGLTTPASPSLEIAIKANLNSGSLIESFSSAYSVVSGTPPSSQSPAVYTGDALNDSGLPIESDDMGVMFNETGEAFNLQENQGVWASFLSAEKTANTVVSAGDVELDITFTLDDGSTERIATTGGSATYTAVQNANRYISSINAQSATTGISASYDASTQKINLVNTNANSSASHNIRLTTIGGTDGSGLTASTVTTAYRYQYNPSASSAIVDIDKTFTTISDLRYALETQAHSLGMLPSSNSYTVTTDGTDDAFNIAINGSAPIVVALGGASAQQVEQTILDVDLVDGDTISVTINGNIYSTAFDKNNAALDSHIEVMTAFAGAITAGEGAITAAFDGTRTITATADTAGTGYILTADYAVTPATAGTATAGAGTDIGNTAPQAQVEGTVLTAALVAGDTVSVTLNGILYSSTFATTNDAAMTALETAINTGVDAANVTATFTSPSTFSVASNTPGTAITVDVDYAVTSVGAGTATAGAGADTANIVAVAQVAQTLLDADLVDGDTISVTINGTAYSSEFDGNNVSLDTHDEVMQALATAITAGEPITAVFDGDKTITATADVAGTPFVVGTDYAVSYIVPGTAAAGAGTDVVNNTARTADENGTAYAAAINVAAITGISATYNSTDGLVIQNTNATLATITVTDDGQSGIPIAGDSINIAGDGDGDGILNENNIEIIVNEQGKFEITNPGASEDGDYDINLKITGLSSTGITENTKFTRNMEVLNTTLSSGSTGAAYSQSFNAATHSSSIDIFDSLGSKHTLRTEFRKTSLDIATGSTWSMLITVPVPATIDTIAPTNERIGSISFNSDGSLATYAPKIISFSGNNGSSSEQQVNISLGTANAFDGMTSFDSPSSTSGISQDGYTGGDLIGIRIDQSGTLIGSFSNGRSFGLAQIGMAKFTNNEGLSTDGGNVYNQTANSGDPIIGTAATSGRGFIQSSALEASNVDLSRALTQLIIIQRGFQANGKTITTSDTLLETLIGLKR